MLDSPSHVSSAIAADNYYDIGGLQSIRDLAKTDSDAALKAVAKQFESFFMRELLKSMRDANDVLAEGNFLNSKTSEFYRDMFDDQLALSLSRDNSIGLADAFYQQLNRNYGKLIKEQNSVDDTVETPSLVAKPTLDQPVANQTLVPPVSLIPASLTSTSLTSAPASSPEAVTAKLKTFNSPREFVTSLLPAAQNAAQALGVDAKLLVAQAALETGWGSQLIHDQQGNNSFNLFGIKAGSNWRGDSVTVTTHEYEDGQAAAQQADFRVYQSYQASFKDYVDFLQSPRYQEALTQAKDAQKFSQGLQQAGYATDPEYAKKIMRIYNSDTLNQVVVANTGYALLRER